MTLINVALAHDDEGAFATDGVLSGGDSLGGGHHLGRFFGEGPSVPSFLPPNSNNIRLIGKLPVGGVIPGHISDVAVKGDYAYLGTWIGSNGSCEHTGVYVIDIKNPSAPQEVAFIPSGTKNFVGEGVHVIKLNTPHFKGDLLVYSVENCSGSRAGTKTGLSLVDVRDPTHPVKLVEGFGDLLPTAVSSQPGEAHASHSVFAWTVETNSSQKAYAVMIDNADSGIDIVDITDPHNPVLIKEYNLTEHFPEIDQDNQFLKSRFAHDMIVKNIEGRQILLISNWDSGYVKLDITDPLNATYIADTDFDIPDPLILQATGNEDIRGAAHQAEFSKDNKYIIGADEVFAATSPGPFGNVDLPLALAGVFLDKPGFSIFAARVGGSGTPPLPDNPVVGQARFVGRACPSLGDTVLPASGPNQFAVIERGVCTFVEKANAVAAAGGYAHTIIMNNDGPGRCSAIVNPAAGDFSVGRDNGFALFDQESDYDEATCLQAIQGAVVTPIQLGKLGHMVQFETRFSLPGYVHLFKNGTGKLVELDKYSIAPALDADSLVRPSVHEIAMSHKKNDLGYIAYYKGGLRVIRIMDDKLVEVGNFNEGTNDFWGVQVWKKNGREYVLGSDRNSGLYIFEYTGPGAPNGNGNFNGTGMWSDDSE